jgi:hypothetical protein
MSKQDLRDFTTDWRRLKAKQYVAVDCDPSRAQLTLSHHWGGNATPEPFRHDLASGAALAWAASPERREYQGGAEYVYNDHFDVDGFLAAWVALNPDEALNHADEVLAAAAAGDFDEWTNERAVQFALLGEWVDDPGVSELARRAFEMPRGSTSEALYRAILAELPELLRHPEGYEELWRQPYDDLLAQLRLFDKGVARVEERGANHLSVISTPRVLRTRAAVARALGDRLLQVVRTRAGYLYVFRYRPYLGYRIVSRPVTPVHDVETLAKALNSRWPSPEERWRPRGWWARDLMLFAQEGNRRKVPQTPPEIAVSLLEEVLEDFDLRHPQARSAY